MRLTTGLISAVMLVGLAASPAMAHHHHHQPCGHWDPRSLTDGHGKHGKCRAAMRHVIHERKRTHVPPQRNGHGKLVKVPDGTQ